jgi:hypothetical protein
MIDDVSRVFTSTGSVFVVGHKTGLRKILLNTAVIYMTHSQMTDDLRPPTSVRRIVTYIPISHPLHTHLALIPRRSVMCCTLCVQSSLQNTSTED